MNNWFVYIIRCTDGSLYTGCTNHIIRRWYQHRQGTGARYLQAHPPESLVYMEVTPNRSEACKREYEIKQFSKQDKEELITEFFSRNKR
ncbi:MAG: GIY-YIG nuclease family protein [Gracilimonas sp.]